MGPEHKAAFSIGSNDGFGQRLCYTDAVLSNESPVLNYGSFWQQQGFTWTSEQTGVTCFNSRRHGFTLSRRSQVLF